ncbi:multicopper oxidase family protein [Amycolatopsis sp. NBC_01488]|uniref:multicopper oxidase family protein n=1 Tax=Amycolatopsis sp. NBC_01488 TaxID=2903563 RepID=UPI002E2DA38A|nr:multicopper oxidase family protein [Amycolatopsis sp. NBC_01488]
MTLGGITAGSAIGGMLLIPHAPTPASAGVAAADDGGGHTGHGQAAGGHFTVGTPFTQRMPVPRELTPRTRSGVDTFTIPIQPAQAEFVPGQPTPVRTYAGQFVGPTIRAKTGRPVRITFTNQLTGPTNVHLHGGHVPHDSDGYPMDLIAPGASRDYDYPNNQQGATLWYHDHAHGLEAENVYLGLHGFYIVEDDAERALNLPSGPYDVPIMLRDALLDENGQLVYTVHPPERTTILANGVVTPHFPVARRKYRFRFLNSATERVFRLKIGGVDMTQIASDGGLLPAPVPRSELVLGSAERADVVIDFSQVAIGTQLVLYDVSGAVLRFDVTRDADDRSRVPATLRPLPSLAAAAVDRVLSMKFDLSGPEPIGLINGQTFDPNRVDFQVKRGSTEIWELHNDDVELGIPHTFHVHLEQFRVLDRGGKPPSLDDAGRKDTVFLAPGEPVRIQVKFTDYLGKYLYHCHYLEHSVHGMMGQVEIVE